MTTGSWVPVWLIVIEGDGYAVKECEGRELDNGQWVVNTRGKGCRSKMLETLAAKYVHATRESAEKRVRELEQDST